MSQLKHPEVPHAQATEKALEALKAMSRQELHETLVSAGIVTPDGKLAPPYNGEPVPSEPASVGCRRPHHGIAGGRQ